MPSVGNWVGIGIKALPYIQAAAVAVERFFGGGVNSTKENEAYEMFKTLLAAGEGITGKDLADDAKVEAAVRNAFKAIVSVQNAIRDVQARRATA